MNWKRGFTRLYLVLWASWLVFVVVRLWLTSRVPLLSLSPENIAAFLVVVVSVGVVAPAILLFALHWIGSGFCSVTDGPSNRTSP